MLIQLLCLSPLILIIILIYPILKIKIFELETRAIGHSSLTIEIFLSEINNNIYDFKRNIILYYSNDIIANKLLFNKWKKIFSKQTVKFYCIPSTILRPIFLLFKLLGLKIFLAPYRHWTDNFFWQRADIHNVLSKTKPNINFDKLENRIGIDYLKKNQISDDKKYICAIFRNSEYYNDSNNSRNVGVNNSLNAIKFFTNKGYKVFLMGGVNLKKNQILKKTTKIIDYSNSQLKTELLDLYLLFNSKFNICADTGLRDIPYMNRKPVALNNFASLEIIPLEDTLATTTFFIPKKYYSINNNQYVKFSKVFELKLYKKNILELKEMGYEIVENSNDEILNLWKETESLIKNNFKREPLDRNNKKFRKIYQDYFGYDIQNLRLTKQFLKKNYKLIN